MRATFNTRKVLYTAILALAPWTPGLAAFPLLAFAAPARALPASPPPPASAAPEAPPPPAAPPAAGDPEPGATAAAVPVLPVGLAGDELWIDVSLGDQRVRVYRGRELVRDMVASTGRPETPTPVGSFRLENRGEWFFSEKYGQGGWWWVSFLNRGEYLFHSVPTDRQRRVLPQEAARLGTPASHGCIRLSLEDAHWLYENAPEGTRVEIHP